MNGTVYKSTGSWYTVKSSEGVFYECRIKGKFRTQGIKSTNPVAVGDMVEFELETIGDETVGIISAIQDRKNYIVQIGEAFQADPHYCRQLGPGIFIGHFEQSTNLYQFYRSLFGDCRGLRHTRGAAI